MHTYILAALAVLLFGPAALTKFVSELARARAGRWPWVLAVPWALAGVVTFIPVAVGIFALTLLTFVVHGVRSLLLGKEGRARERAEEARIIREASAKALAARPPVPAFDPLDD